MARINVPDGEGLEAYRMWGLAPDICAGMHALSEAVYTKSSLSVREREVARMRIAQLNQCVV
jgi:alkylhydroperoxidase family enzyme